MKLTLDEAMRRIDQVSDLLYEMVNQEVTIKRTPQSFFILWGNEVEIRAPEDWMPTREEFEVESLERLSEAELDWLPEDGYDDD